MIISELNGRAVKKLIKAKSCSFRYHNKNNLGGNFGFEIRGIYGKDYELNGEYRHSFDGLINTIRFGKVYWPRIELIKENIIDSRSITLQDILNRMMAIINLEEVK